MFFHYIRKTSEQSGGTKFCLIARGWSGNKMRLVLKIITAAEHFLIAKTHTAKKKFTPGFISLIG